MQCDYFDAGECRSCSLMGVPYAEQLADKDRRVQATLRDVAPDVDWQAPFASTESGFRNKAKLAIGGTADAPTLGILDRGGVGIDLRDCGLYEPGLLASFEPLREFIQAAALMPYSVAERRGELKYLIITHAPTGELMVRFVLRSRALLAKVQSRLLRLTQALPSLQVASINIHPEHRAVLEGDVELALTSQQRLPIPVNDVTLLVGPQSFFQTNSAVAAGLYRHAREWLDGREIRSLWDLYCGVGGFALHLGRAGRSVHGIEVSPDAVRAARAATPPGANIHFYVGDARAARSLPRPDAIVVNPPRRGIGEELCAQLESSGAPLVLYSSCHPATLRDDLGRLPSYTATTGRLFDMFPQTAHSEVLVLLERRR